MAAKIQPRSVKDRNMQMCARFGNWLEQGIVVRKVGKSATALCRDDHDDVEVGVLRLPKQIPDDFISLADHRSSVVLPPY